MPAMKAPSPSGKKEPEDIFADLDHGSGSASAPAQVFDVPERKSPLKLILITIAILVIVAAGGVSAWYFLIRSEPPAEVGTPLPSANSPVVTAEPEPVVETPIAQPGDQQTPPPPVAPPPNAPPPQPVGTPALQPTEAPDSDSDGLSDPEEAVLSTDPALPDTDSDTFTDGAELMSGYDPAAQRTSLESSTHFHAVTIANAWSVLLPITWTVGLDAAAPGDYAIQTGTPTAFTVHVGQKDPSMSFTDWLASNDPTADPSVLRSLTTRAGYSAFEAINRLSAYIVTDTSVIVIHYRVNTASSYDYRALYDYVIQTIRQL